jgi:hypothetical protein
MTSISVRTGILPPLAGLWRIIFFISTFFEILADAQRAAADAHNRYPFAW